MKKFRVVKESHITGDDYTTISVPEKQDILDWLKKDLKKDLKKMQDEIESLNQKIADLEKEKKQRENMFQELAGKLKQCVISTNEEAMTNCLALMSKWMTDQINQKNAKQETMFHELAGKLKQCVISTCKEEMNICFEAMHAETKSERKKMSPDKETGETGAPPAQKSKNDNAQTSGTHWGKGIFGFFEKK